MIQGHNIFLFLVEKYLLSNLMASSISELILLSLNINNIRKDRFLENALLDLLYKN